MFDSLKIPIIIFVLFILSACSESNISIQELNDLSNISANITISQDPYVQKNNQIDISFRDIDGKQINSSSVSILVNGVHMKHHTVHDLYYSERYIYRVRGFAAKEAYYFEIILPNGRRLPLAHSNIIKPIKKSDIKLAETGSITQPTTISWRNLDDYTQLIVSTSFEKIEGNMTTVGTDDNKLFMINLNRDISTYTVSRQHYEGKESALRSISFEFSTEIPGLLNPALLPGSQIKSTAKVSRYISME